MQKTLEAAQRGLSLLSGKERCGQSNTRFSTQKKLIESLAAGDTLLGIPLITDH
jgi:hypothetical protein